MASATSDLVIKVMPPAQGAQKAHPEPSQAQPTEIAAKSTATSSGLNNGHYCAVLDELAKAEEADGLAVLTKIVFGILIGAILGVILTIAMAQ